MNFILYALGLLYFMLPAYAANMLPVFVRKIPILDSPMDMGKRYRGFRLLGRNKTWRGVVVAVLGGYLMYDLQFYLYTNPFFQSISIIDYSTTFCYLGAVMGLGAIMGDAVKSFFKRQMNIKSGKPWPPFDQIDYSIGALLFASPWYFVGFPEAIFIVAASAVLHLLVKWVGFQLKIGKAKI